MLIRVNMLIKVNINININSILNHFLTKTVVGRYHGNRTTHWFPVNFSIIQVLENLQEKVWLLIPASWCLVGNSVIHYRRNEWIKTLTELHMYALFLKSSFIRWRIDISAAFLMVSEISWAQSSDVELSSFYSNKGNIKSSTTGWWDLYFITDNIWLCGLEEWWSCARVHLLSECEQTDNRFLLDSSQIQMIKVWLQWKTFL